ncbi:MAG: PEGA domain-containing protein [Acidobacteriota bacterium]
MRFDQRAEPRLRALPAAIGGLTLLATLALAAPATAKEPLRPRGSEPVAGTATSTAPAQRPTTSRSSGRRDSGTAATRGDRRRQSTSSSDRYRRGDRRSSGYSYDHRRRHRVGYHGYPRYRGHYDRSFRIGYHYSPYYRYHYRYRPYSYSWYSPFSVYSVWGPWWGPQVVVDAGRPYGRYYGNAMGALDLDVSPEKAQIFIDGNYVGVADEYDGFPAYLWLEKGTYDVAIYHPGYETIFRQYTVHDGLVIDVNDRLQPGEALHPDDHGPTTTVHRDRRLQRNAERAERVDRLERLERRRDDQSRLVLAIWPEDAAVYLNGHFVGTGAELGDLAEGLVLQPGQHSLETVRPGYETDERTVTVAPGQTLDLEIDLGEPEGDV